jgi:hypothetical protein
MMGVWLLGAVAAFFLVVAFLDLLRLLILLPIQRSRTEFVLTDPEYVDFEPGKLPAYFQAPFKQTAEALASLGFAAAMHARKRHATQRVESYHSAWIAPELGCSAHLYLIRITGSAATVQTSDVIFCNEFEDGTCVFTTNQSVHGLPEDSRWRIIHWPDMRNLRALLDFHLKRVAHHAEGRRSVLVSKTEMKSHAKMWHRRAMEPAVAEGLYEIDEMARLYRLTIRGARLTSHRARWPLKGLRAAADARKLRAELSAVGMSTDLLKQTSSLVKEPGFPVTPA